MSIWPTKIKAEKTLAIKEFEGRSVVLFGVNFTIDCQLLQKY
jgi:hypothetical protein